MGGGTEHPLARRITDGLDPRAWTVAVAILAVTTRWKISVHTAVSGGAVALLGLTCGPWVPAGYALVALVGRSRVRHHHHTPAQATAGTALGAAVAGPVFLGLV